MAQRIADGTPHDLAHRCAVPAGALVGDVDAVDHRDAEAVQHRGYRQQERIGVACHEAQHHMQGDDQDREHGAEEDEGQVDVAEGAELHEHDCDRVDGARHDEQAEFEVPQLLRKSDAAHGRRLRGGVDHAGVVSRHWCPSSRSAISVADLRDSALMVASTAMRS